MVAATLGWVGAAGTLFAYLAVSRGWLCGKSRRYAALNITGGLMAGTAAGMYGAWPSAASNIVWALIGVATLATHLREARRHRLVLVSTMPAPRYSMQRVIAAPSTPIMPVTAEAQSFA
ncbi:CBU_0592 family membrane protein [Mycolicibacterium sp. 22603]|uniref:CBU_0592 family membrane protein n=1 Tax=Mycolicibacterium sp. 22603 TaxID=3453950 RepID=UPI003F8324C8